MRALRGFDGGEQSKEKEIIYRSRKRERGMWSERLVAIRPEEKMLWYIKGGEGLIETKGDLECEGGLWGTRRTP